jgi:hypothetical protein
MPYANHDEQIKYMKTWRRKNKQQKDADRLAVGLRPHGLPKQKVIKRIPYSAPKPLAPPIEIDPEEEGRRLLNSLRPPRTAKNSIEKVKPEPPKPKQPAFIFM